MSNYGAGQVLTYGQLFGPQPAPYGGIGAGISQGPPGGSSSGTGAVGKRRREYIWTGGKIPGLRIQGIGIHRVIILAASVGQRHAFTPLPAPHRSWNDAQDLEDLLRILGMT